MSVRAIDAILQTYQAHFEALVEDVVMTPYDFRYTSVGLKLFYFQVCASQNSQSGSNLSSMIVHCRLPKFLEF